MKNLLMTVEHLCCLDYMPWICLVGGGFIPSKDPPPALRAGRDPGPSCGSRSLPIRARRALDQTGSSVQKPRKKHHFDVCRLHAFLFG